MNTITYHRSIDPDTAVRYARWVSTLADDGLESLAAREEPDTDGPVTDLLVALAEWFIAVRAGTVADGAVSLVPDLTV